MEHALQHRLHCVTRNLRPSRLRAVGLADSGFRCYIAAGDGEYKSFTVADCTESGVDDFYVLEWVL